MAVFLVDVAPCARRTTPEPAVPIAGDDLFQAAAGRVDAECRHVPSWTLDLSRSRTHDAVLDILKAHKLSGNFHVNLEAVLKHMDVYDKVTFEIERNPGFAWFSDCRHVAFRRNENIPVATFDDIVKSVAARIGFDTRWRRRLKTLRHWRISGPSRADG
jgi:hypothetical protein